MEQNQPSSLDEIIPPVGAAKMLGYKHRQAIWRLVRQKVLPQPIRITAGKCGWRRSTLEQFIAEREKAVAA